MTLLSKINFFSLSSAKSSHSSANTSRLQGSPTSPKKSKGKVVEKEVHVESLTLWLDRVVGIDPPSRSTLPESERVYQVLCRVDGPGDKEIDAFNVVKGLPNPSWCQRTTVPLKGHPLGKGFLNVEVLRYNSKENLSNPGTSDCPSIGAVSRVRIPLPATINERINGRYDLVKCDGAGDLKPEGYIILAMGLKGVTYY